MRTCDMGAALTSDLIGRYARLEVDRRRFAALLKKAKDEMDEIYRELYKGRNMRSGGYVLDGNEVMISFHDGIAISTQKYLDVNKIKGEKC